MTPRAGNPVGGTKLAQLPRMEADKMTRTSQTPMTPRHPRWKRFVALLEGPEGCNFRDKGPDCKDRSRYTWTCNGGNDHTLARTILEGMGFSEPAIQNSLEYFTEHGGCCDCEIVFNVAREMWD